jgi:hypothetical protein
MKSIFSASDLKTIDEKGLTKKDVADQIKAFEKGSTPVKLDRPCTMGDGIITIPESEMEHLQNVHDRAAEAGRMTKMVPASGAASRMFKDWFEYYETKGLDGTEKGAAFLETLGRFAFYGDLKKAVSRNGETLEALIGDVKVSEIL